MDEVKGELLERYKVLPALNSRLAEAENQNKELREKNKQLEMKLGTMQVSGCGCRCSVSLLEPSGLADPVCVCVCEQKLLSSHSEKLMDVELELRPMRLLRDELENLKGTLENLRSRVSSLEGAGRGSSGTTSHTLGQYRGEGRRRALFLLRGRFSACIGGVSVVIQGVCLKLYRGRVSACVGGVSNCIG